MKKAYNRLLDEAQRRNIVDNIEMVTQQTQEMLSKEWKKKGDSPSEKELEAEVGKALMKHFAEMEVAKQRSDALIRKNNMREKVQEMERVEKDQEYFREQKAWNDEEGREARVGGWRDFAHGGLGKGKVKKRPGESFRPEAGSGTERKEEEQPDWKKQRK